MERAKKRILLIDDESSWARSVKMLLQDKYDMDLAENGKQGLDRIRKLDYDLVVIDYQLLEEKTGTDIMIELKQFNKVVPVILVSGKIEERGPIIEAIQKGVTSYVEKDAQLSRRLPVEIERALNERDSIILALEKWLGRLEKPERVLIRTMSGKEYSAKQILEEVKKDSENGRQVREGIVRAVIELIQRGERKV